MKKQNGSIIFKWLPFFTKLLIGDQNLLLLWHATETPLLLLRPPDFSAAETPSPIFFCCWVPRFFCSWDPQSLLLLRPSDHLLLRPQSHILLLLRSWDPQILLQLRPQIFLQLRPPDYSAAETPDSTAAETPRFFRNWDPRLFCSWDPQSHILLLLRSWDPQILLQLSMLRPQILLQLRPQILLQLRPPDSSAAETLRFFCWWDPQSHILLLLRSWDPTILLQLRPQILLQLRPSDSSSPAPLAYILLRHRTSCWGIFISPLYYRVSHVVNIRYLWWLIRLSSHPGPLVSLRFRRECEFARIISENVKNTSRPMREYENASLRE